MGEYEPNESRNVTGTATTPDGRWTARGQQPPNAEGETPGQQTQQSGDQSQAGEPSIRFEPDPQLSQQVQQGDESIGQTGEGVSGPANQANDHTSGIGQEQQFTAQEAATGQAGQTGWKTGDAAGQVRHGQSVIDRDGQHVGTIDSVDGDRIKLTRGDSADGLHHYVLASDVDTVEGEEVRLNCTADQVQS